MANLISMPPPTELSEMEKALELIKKDLPIFLEFQIYQAKMHKSKYDALIREGFNEYQALELCKI